jgi:DNA polymerase-3 subunit beta
MRFTISREKLQEGLAAVTASIPAKTTLPVLANIMVEATEKGIRLSGTDLDIAGDDGSRGGRRDTGRRSPFRRKNSARLPAELPPAPVRVAQRASNA